MRLWFSALLTLLFTAPSYAVSFKTKVAATGDLTCNAYLHYPENTRGELPFFWAQSDAGANTKSRPTDLDPVSAYLLRTGKAAILTFDRPGIEADVSQPNGYRINDAVFSRVSSEDLVSCGANAVAWAMNQPAASLTKGLAFFGFGEGASIVTRAYARGLRTEAAWAKAVKLLELASVPSLRSNLDNLAELKAPATFHFYQGLDDAQTPPAEAMDLEDHPPALNISVRYYHAGHALNQSAVNDQLFAWFAYFL